MRALQAALMLFLLAVSAGCLSYDARQELPASIAVDALPEGCDGRPCINECSCEGYVCVDNRCVQDSPIECKSPDCVTIVKEVQKKNTKYECSPPFKGANDDPRGTIYIEDRGDKCEPLPVPDTLCLKYDCSFSPDKLSGYYKAYYACSGKDAGLGFGVTHMFEGLKIGTKYDGLGSMGQFKESVQSDTVMNFVCNAVSSEMRGEGYKTEGSRQLGCYTCPSGGSLLLYVPSSCPAEMPIKYPYNAYGFKYSPIISQMSDPGENVIRNLKLDYLRLYDGTKPAEGVTVPGISTSEKSIGLPECRQWCDNLDEHPEHSEMCSECTKQNSNNAIKKKKEDNKGEITSRGYTYADLKKDENLCTGLNPCVEIDRAGILGLIPTTRYSGNSLRYFTCGCECEVPLYSAYKCTRPGSSTEYYYSHCERTEDKTSQGGYIYELHNYTGGMFKEILESNEAEIPVFMIGQGPTFKDYEVAKSLCRPTSPADIFVKAGNLPFIPNNVTVFEGGQVCLKNDGASSHQIYRLSTLFTYIPYPVLLANLSSGDGACFGTGPGTNFTRGTTMLMIDDNLVALAKVSVVDPQGRADIINKVELDRGGLLTFKYMGVVPLDITYASGYYPPDTPILPITNPLGQITGYAPGLAPVLEAVSDGHSETLYAAFAGEHNYTLNGEEFTYVVYTEGDSMSISGSGLPIFRPAAISLPEGSKFCIKSEVPETKKTLILQKKVSHEPEMYAPLEAKSLYYGLECCFTLSESGVYRVADSDYQQGMKGYVVVYPSETVATISVNDYAYAPYSSIGKKDDYMCIANSVGVDREIKYTSDAGESGRFMLNSFADYCTYDFSKVPANYKFTDQLTGGEFFYSSTGGDVLNVDVYSIAYAPANGRIGAGGQVCFNAIDSDVALKGPVRVTGSAQLDTPSESLAGAVTGIRAGQKICVKIDSEGLYMFKNMGSEGHFLVSVGSPGTVYIVKGVAVPNSAQVTFPNFMKALKTTFDLSVFDTFPKVKIENIDDVDYHVYNEVTIGPATGFSFKRIDLVSPNTAIRNNLNYDIGLTVHHSAGESQLGTVKSGDIYLYEYVPGRGDYRINITGFKQDSSSISANLGMEINAQRMLSTDGIVFRRGAAQEYSITSVRSSVLSYYTKDGGGYEKAGMLIIKGDVEGGVVAMAAESGVYDTLGFGVQVLSGPPDTETLMQARKMLAYDNTLPVFLYSRIGDINVDLIDPSTPEMYAITEGADVNVMLDGITWDDVRADPSTYKGDNEFPMPGNDVVYTIRRDSAEKEVTLKSITPVKEIKMSYEHIKIDGHNTDNYIVKVHNLANDPRAIMIRPSSIGTMCSIVSEGGSATINSADKWSSRKLNVYMLDEAMVRNPNLNTLEYHDPYVGEGISKLTEITLLPNLGYTDIRLSLSRDDGQLVLQPDAGRVDGTLAGALTGMPILPPGFISGLKDTVSAGVYRIFSDKAGASADIRYMDISLDGKVYDTGYAILLRRFAPSQTWPVLTSSFVDNNNLALWKGSIFKVNNVMVFPNKWLNVWSKPGQETWYRTSCGYGSDFIVPFSSTVFPKEYAYSLPHILGSQVSGSPFEGGAGKYSYLRTENNLYAILPHVVGAMPYRVGSLEKQHHWIYDVSFKGSQWKNDLLTPENLRITNGEIIKDIGGLKFVENEDKQIPCGRLFVDDKFPMTEIYREDDGDLGDAYSSWDLNSYNCYTKKNIHELDIWGNGVGDNIWGAGLVVYNKYGSACGFAGQYGKVEDGKVVKSMDDPGEHNMWWCRSTSSHYGHEATALGADKHNWNVADVRAGIGNYQYYTDGIYYPSTTFLKKVLLEGTATPGVIQLSLSDTTTGGQVYDFMDTTYYEFPEPSCGSESKSPHYTTPSISGKISESALSGGAMFFINDIELAKGYFDSSEITDGVSELSLGYAVTETFKVENKQGTKALCFGDDSFDGIQDVISPLAVNTYTPDAHGTYSIYDAPYYPNLLWEGSSFSHLSPFARPLSGSELGTFEFNVQSITSNNRKYIKAEINLNEVLKNNEIVDIYLYNLTLTADLGGRLAPVDNIELMEGETLVLNNTGPDKILWYYGKLDPCGENDIEGIIEEKLMSSCGGADGLEDCIKNPRDYSVSPTDMISYLDTKGGLVGKIEIPSGATETFFTAGNHKNMLPGPSGDETSAGYMFYNPYSGKSFTANVYREVVDVKLQINSFSPGSISVAEGSQVCITNTDDVDRGLDVFVSSPETITLSPGERKCFDADPEVTRAIVDPITGRKLERTISEYGNGDVLDTLREITREIAIPKSGASNPVYDYQLLNPRAPATPSVISTEVIDVDVLVRAVDEFDFEVFKGIAQQVAVIEETCRFEQAAKAQQCGAGAGQGPPNDNLEHIFEYVDFSIEGCCCRKIGEKEIDYSDCIPLDEERCTGSYKYTYTCPYETSVYKQRCLSTIPIYIKIGADETEISPEKVKAMKMAIDLIHNELDNIEPFRSDRGETVDLLGFIILIEDPGLSKRGECKIASYLEGIKNVSKHAVVEHGAPSIILGFGLNRNLLESRSCWTNTELGEQVRGLYQEEFMTMIGYGIIGMGQYCLIDTACQPLSVGGSPGNDYGLYYKQGETFTYHGDSAVLLGTPSFTDYLTFSLLGGGTSTLGTNWLVDAGITGYQEGFDPEQGVSLFSGYSGISGYHEGISALGAYGVGTPSSPFMSFAADLNDPSRVLSGLTRKDPYARAWFDQCGKYYYEGMGMVTVTFSGSDIPPGQQGSQCDPSRMMELYKKYKCE